MSSFYAEFVHTYMCDTMNYCGTEIVNSMREVIRSNGGSVDMDKMSKEMPKAGHYPELVDVEPLGMLTFITKEYVDFMNERMIYFENGLFSEVL